MAVSQGLRTTEFTNLIAEIVCHIMNILVTELSRSVWENKGIRMEKITKYLRT